MPGFRIAGVVEVRVRGTPDLNCIRRAPRYIGRVRDAQREAGLLTRALARPSPALPSLNPWPLAPSATRLPRRFVSSASPPRSRSPGAPSFPPANKFYPRKKRPCCYSPTGATGLRGSIRRLILITKRQPVPWFHTPVGSVCLSSPLYSQRRSLWCRRAGAKRKPPPYGQDSHP